MCLVMGPTIKKYFAAQESLTIYLQEEKSDELIGLQKKKLLYEEARCLNKATSINYFVRAI